MLNNSFVHHYNRNGNISISSTQGAGLVDDLPRETNAFDLLTIQGKPAKTIVVYTEGNGFFSSDPLQGKITTLTMNAYGYGFAKACRRADTNYTPLTFTAYDTVDADNPVSTIATYGIFRRGPGRFSAINYTIGAPNINGSYCSIFLKINPNISGSCSTINHVNVKLMSKDLTLLNSDCGDRVAIKSDFTVSIDISSSSPGKKRIYLSMDESPDGEYVPIDLIFIALA